MNVFELFGTIAIDNKKANDAIDETGEKGGKLKDKLNSGFGKIGKAAVTAGKVIGTGLIAGTVAMGKITVDALNLAGSLEQSLGGAKAVFGDYWGVVQRKAEDAYKTMGLSQTEYLEVANKMGALFKGSGIDQATAVDMTTDAMQRAADVASIMGISTEDAMQAVAGMAKGNFTMMDNLGVAMNDTTLAAYAQSKGYSKLWKDMSTGEKVMVAQEMFMERTAYAAGNYSRENDTLAGSIQTAKAALNNFLSGAGGVDQVVDSFSNAAEVIVSNLNTLLPKLTKGLTEIIKKLTPMIGPLIQTALPGILEGATALLIGLAEALPELISVLIDVLPDVLSKLGAALVKIIPKLFEGIKNAIEKIDFNALGEWFGNAIMDLVASIPDLLSNLGQTISWAWNTIVWPLIQGLFKAVFGVDLPDWGELKQKISDGWKNKVWPAIQNYFKEKFGIDLPDWEETWKSIKEWWGKVKAAFGNFFSALFNIQTTDEDGNGKPWYKVITDWFNGVLEQIGNIFCAIFGIELEEGETIGSKIHTWWSEKVWPGIKDFFKAVFGIDLPDWSEIWTSIQDWWANVKKAYAGYFSALFSIETTDEDGNGIPWSEVITNWFKGVLKNAGNVFCAIFGIEFTDKDGNGITWWQAIKNWWTETVWPNITGFFKEKFNIDVPTWNEISKAIKGVWDDIKKAWNQWSSKLWVTFGFTSFEEAGLDEDLPDAMTSATWTNQPGHATGLDRVPYNDYPALLHRNEAVLTASEAAAWRSGENGGSNAGVIAALNTVSDILRAILTNTGAGQNIVLDSGVLVGQLTPQIDAQLGARAARRGRG